MERLGLTGRIDSITCREIESLFRNAVLAGKRLIVADMTGVSYVSSAGLRVFLSFQKELKKAGGEVCLFNCAPPVYSVFELSGFTNIFRFLTSEKDIDNLAAASGEKSAVEEIASGKAILRSMMRTVEQGTMTVIGNDVKLASSDYDQGDVVEVAASDLSCATGFAALGNTFDDYKGYFGEAVAINGSLFVYPALRRSAVDFVIPPEGGRDTVYHFLHGFSFGGEFSRVLSFEPRGAVMTLDDLVDAVCPVAASNVLGIVAIFESKGLFGMRLKKIPLRENRAAGETDIFSGANFPEWVDYSIEAEDVYNLVIMTGVAVRERNRLSAEVDRIIPGEGRFHIHGIVFEKKPFNKTLDNFANEVKRIVTVMEPQRVLHLLGKSQIGPGLMGIVELGG